MYEYLGSNDKTIDNSFYEYGDPEFDNEVDDGMIMASPGGISSHHHHYTKGFYGQGGSSTDKFGHQGDRYPHGIYGNLYEQGNSAADKLGMYPLDSQERLWENDDSFEVIEDIKNIEGFTPMTSGNAEADYKKYHPIIILSMIVLLYVTFDLWSMAAQKFIIQYVHGGLKIGWKDMVKYAGGLTVLFLSLAWVMEIPIWIFE